MTTFLPASRTVQAEVEVVAVQRAERLVEAQVAHDPRRQAQDEAVDGVDLAGAGVGRLLLAAQANAGQLAAAELAVACG